MGRSYKSLYERQEVRLLEECFQPPPPPPPLYFHVITPSMLWATKWNKLFHCLDDILVFSLFLPFLPIPLLPPCPEPKGQVYCVVVLSLTFLLPLRSSELLSCHPRRIIMACENEQKQLRRVRLHHRTQWLRRWTQHADMRPCQLENSWQCLWISAQCQMLTWVSHTHTLTCM